MLAGLCPFQLRAHLLSCVFIYCFTFDSYKCPLIFKAMPVYVWMAGLFRDETHLVLHGFSSLASIMVGKLISSNDNLFTLLLHFSTLSILHLVLRL